MNTQVAKFTAFNVLLNITDLLAPNAKTHVINSVIPNAIKSGVRSAMNIPQIYIIHLNFHHNWFTNSPKIVPIVPAMLLPIAPPDNESKLALRAQAHALVPKKLSTIFIFGLKLFFYIFQMCDSLALAFLFY